MPVIHVDLRISADEWLKIYRGEARVVRATSRDGRRLQFPATILQPFVTRNGIAGTFEIEFSEAGKFLSIIKMGQG